MLQVTAFELQKQREADARASAQASAQRDQAKRREVGADEYGQMVAAHNDNTEDGIDARNVDAALAQMSVNEECVLVACLQFAHFLQPGVLVLLFNTQLMAPHL